MNHSTANITVALNHSQPLQPSPLIHAESLPIRASPSPSTRTLRRTPNLERPAVPEPLSRPFSRIDKQASSRSHVLSQALSDSEDDETLTVPEFPSHNHGSRRVAVSDETDQSFSAYLRRPPIHRSKRNHRAVLFTLEEALRGPYAFTPDIVEEEANITEPFGIQLVYPARTPTPDPVPVPEKPVFRQHRRTQSQPVSAPPAASRSYLIQKVFKISSLESKMTSRHKTPTVSSTAPAVSALANHTGIKSPTQIMKERQDRERRRAEQKEHDSMLRDQEKRRQVAAEKELGLEEEARRRSAERRAAAAAGGPHSQPQPSQSQQPYMSAAGGSSQQPPATPRSRHNHNHSHSHSNGANPADTTIKKTPISGSNSKASFPHAFERWETLSAQWEGLTRHWIRRLEMNGAMLDTDPLSKTLSRQVTDLSAAGANLFHAVVELQRLRASSERKFQRWFFETRGELERLQEDKAQLEAALRDEQNNRRETTAQVQNTETVNLLQRQLAEMKKELTISKEEARRAWEELGRREHEERERTFSLQNGQPTIVGGVQVVPMGTGGGRRDAAHNGQPGASYTPPHQPPAGSGISYVTDGSAYQSAYVLDAAGNEVLDAHGRPIPYQTTGSPLQSHPDMDDYDLPSSRSHHHYQSMSSPSAAAGPSGAGAGSSAGASSSAPSSSIPATAGASAPAQYNSAVAWDMADAKHQHPTRLSDVLEEEESRTTGSHVGRS